MTLIKTDNITFLTGRTVNEQRHANSLHVILLDATLINVVVSFQKRIILTRAAGVVHSERHLKIGDNFFFLDLHSTEQS
jgi:hypothetical protein